MTKLCTFETLDEHEGIIEVRNPNEIVGISFINSDARTVQSDYHRCNINEIMSKFAVTGLIDHLNSAEPRFGDFSEHPDFQGLHDARIMSREIYDNLPESVRSQFTYEDMVSNDYDFIQEEPEQPEPQPEPEIDE